jgi:predicted ATPase
MAPLHQHDAQNDDINDNKPLLNFQELPFYGRELELKTLQQAFERVKQQHQDCPTAPHRNEQRRPGVEIVLVHGISGTGKSKLIQEFKEANRRSDGVCFLQGKCDHHLEQLPYAALIHTFAQLGDVLKDNENIDAALQKDLRPDEQALLVSAIPSIRCMFPKLSLRTEAESAELPPSDTNTFSKLKFAARDFIRCVSREMKPLVLILDDMQWADSASLEVLRVLITDTESSFLFVGSFREELDGADPLSILIQSLLHLYDGVHDIHLPEFEQEQILSLISNLLTLEACDVEPLVDAVMATSQGNVLFVLHFLLILQHKGVIFWSLGNYRWQWDQALVLREAARWKTVVGVMAAELSGLDEKSLQALKIASCLGSSFRIDTLTILMNAIDMVDLEDYLTTHVNISIVPETKKLEEVQNLLQEVMDVGLIVRDASGDRYRFAHDSIVEASYYLIPDGSDRYEMHFKLGKLLYQLSLLQEGHEDWTMLIALCQLNKGSPLVVDKAMKVQLAQLNLEAAERVLLLSAFSAASDYLRQGLEFLNRDTRWKDNYELTLKLSTTLASVFLCKRNFVGCKHVVDEVILNARCFDDKFDVYHIMIQSLGSQGRFDEAFAIGRSVLSLLGEGIHKTFFRLASNILQIKFAVLSKSDDQLVNTPQMQRQDKLQAILILRSLAGLAWISDRSDWMLHVQCRVVQLSLKYGMSPFSSYGFAIIGMALGVMGNIDDSVRLGEIATKLSEKHHPKGCDCYTIAVCQSFLVHWKRPFTECLDPLLHAFQSGMGEGDIAPAFYCACSYAVLGYLRCQSLAVLNAETKQFVTMMNEYGATPQTMILIPQLQLTLNFAGESENPRILSGTEMNLEEFLQECFDVNHMRAVFKVYLGQMTLAYHFGDLATAYDMVIKLKRVDLKTEGPAAAVPIRLFFMCMVYVDMFRTTNKKNHMKEACKILVKFEKWTKQGAVNVDHLYLLGRAEMLGAKNDVGTRDAYDAAITSCKAGGFLHPQALANEKAGVFALRAGDTATAISYMLEAKVVYTSWGAFGIVDFLESKYKFLFYDHASTASSRNRKERRRIERQGRNLKRSMLPNPYVCLPTL